jgi:Gene product 88
MLLTQGNRELRKDGIFTWSIPALSARLNNGENVVTCPNAGVCAKLCYARSGTYRFSNVRQAHVRITRRREEASQTKEKK